MNLSSLLLPLIIVLFAVPLFLGTRKQKRQVQQQQEMQNSLSYGDRVMTTSGLHATVVSVSDDSIDLEIADGVVTTWLRAAVREKIADSTIEPEVDEYEDADEADETEVDAVETEHEVVAETPEQVEDAKPALEETSKKAR
jgi:preprotein translocase subunit YajC